MSTNTDIPTVDPYLARFEALALRQRLFRPDGRHVTAAARERAYRTELRAMRRDARKKP